MESTPVSLQRDGENGLVIHWSQGETTNYTAAQLRKACPCATCREKHGGDKHSASDNSAVAGSPGRASLPVLALAEARPLQIRSMRPVGNYAYNISFSDGHDSGIYTFEYLLELGASSA